MREALIVAELALAVTLLVGTSLLLRSLLRVLEVDQGFRSERLLTMAVELPADRYTDRESVTTALRRIPETIEKLPGVAAASAVSTLPISGGDGSGDVTVEGRPFAPAEVPSASYRRVNPNYFRTMGIPLIRGREFDERDGEGPPVVIVSQGMARLLWPDQDPIGRRIKVGPPEREPWLTVVGVAGDVRNVALDRPPRFATYEPLRQRPWSTVQLVVRATGDPAALVPAVRHAIRAIDPAVRTYDAGTMDRRIAQSLAPRRFQLALVGGFGALALLLAAVGTYGVISYAVAQRTREFGVRFALGATPSVVTRGVMARGMRLAAAGLVAGMAIALVATTPMADLLFGVRAHDWVTYAVVAVLLAAVALAASYLPARRAARIEPMTALRIDT